MAGSAQTEMKQPSFGKRGRGPDRFAPGEKPKDTKGTLMRIVHIYMHNGGSIFIAVFFTAVSALITVAAPYMVGRSFDYFHVDTGTVDTQSIMAILTAIAILHVVNWISTTLSGVILLRVSQRLVFTLRADFFDKLQRLPLSFFDTRPHGDTMSRLTNDVDNISSTIAQTTTQIVTSTLSITGSVIVMFSLNVPLTFTVLLVVPVLSIMIRIIAKMSRSYFISQQYNLGVLNGVIEENIQGLKIVKAFGRQDDLTREFSVVNEKLCYVSTKANTWAGYLMPLMNVTNNLIFTLVSIIGGLLSVGYGLQVGTVVTFLGYSKQFGSPLSNLAGMFNQIQSALAGAERVFQVMDEQEETHDPINAVEMDRPLGNIEFENVCFSYTQDRPILTDISFKVDAGMTVALVGETGAGKTTLVNLLTRFYDADSGRILIDGISITDIKRDSLRKCFSVVLQETCLFTGTIMDNIRYSRPDATENEVVNAAKHARAHDFIEKLPKGYYTLVSGSTDNLSEGQRQLIAIARAVLSGSPILILDEATSSVDTKTEKDIQRAFANLMKNRTSFLIAHRLSTIRDADRIMVVGDKKIIESGSHKELMAKKGVYYEMVMSQLGVGV
ncbi:MAG: ABC transporter ATP-binding protein/permease [Clostridiales bacterium]|jgi:ATP-binding cassette subfamily B protein|nr:ABC transporter ATP-binding protein/permease [Clostridiales bacterium]